MNRKLLILSVAALALAATGASAKTKHHARHAAAHERYAAPPQPIPYAELDSYVGGSHHGGHQIASRAPMAPASSEPSNGMSSSAPAATTGAPPSDTTGSAAPSATTGGSTGTSGTTGSAPTPTTPEATPAPPTSPPSSTPSTTPPPPQ